MLRCLANKKRFLEITQIVLAFVSVIAAADATRSRTAYDLRSPAVAADFVGEGRDPDRRFNDLARFERKRREAAQRSSLARRASRRPAESRSEPAMGAAPDQARLSATAAVGP